MKAYQEIIKETLDADRDGYLEIGGSYRIHRDPETGHAKIKVLDVPPVREIRVDFAPIHHLKPIVESLEAAGKVKPEKPEPDGGDPMDKNPLFPDPGTKKKDPLENNPFIDID